MMPIEGGGREGRCAGCRAELELRHAFLFRGETGPLIKCARSAQRHRPMLVRSMRVSLIVGTVLIAINQGDVAMNVGDGVESERRKGIAVV